MNEPYILDIINAVGKRNTRAELRRIFFNQTGRTVPPGMNLRTFVSTFHGHQQAINGGLPASKFWRSIHHYD